MEQECWKIKRKNHFKVGISVKFGGGLSIWYIEKCLKSYTILEAVRMRVLEWIDCTKCTICIISLVIKWEKLWSEFFYELWMIRVVNWNKILKCYFLWDTKFMHKIWSLQCLCRKIIKSWSEAYVESKRVMLKNMNLVEYYDYGYKFEDTFWFYLSID